MKGSGCVRVTASGACATSGSLKDDPGAGQTLLSIRCNATVFVEKMFRPIMSSTNTALVATQSSAEASGDKGDPDRVRVTFVAAKPRNAIAPHCRQLAKSRPRSALPSRRGLEFMFEAQPRSMSNGSAVFRLPMAGLALLAALATFGPLQSTKIGPLSSPPADAARRERARSP